MHETVDQSGEDQTAYPPHVHFAIFSPNYVIEISCHGNRRFGVWLALCYISSRVCMPDVKMCVYCIIYVSKCKMDVIV